MSFFSEKCIELELAQLEIINVIVHLNTFTAKEGFQLEEMHVCAKKQSFTETYIKNFSNRQHTTGSQYLSQYIIEPLLLFPFLNLNPLGFIFNLLPHQSWYWLNYWHTLISKDTNGFTAAIAYFLIVCQTISFGNVKAMVQNC